MATFISQLGSLHRIHEMSRRRLIRVAGAIAVMVGASLALTGLGPSRPPPQALRAAPVVMVYKSPTCGCCTKWADHMRDAGFAVTVDHPPDLAAVRQQMGVPLALGSCHTAVVGGYVIEGHVPPADVQRLLRERPDVRGITVPGMPLGAPGMDGPNLTGYDVLLLHHDGTTSVFEHHAPDQRGTR